VAQPTDTTYDDGLIVIRALLESGHQAMFAGGCVRDRLLGKKPKDYDVATSALPSKMTSVFKKMGYRVIPTGVEHGTVSVIMPSGPIEVTTLRHDVKTDGRHAVVDFENATFASDAARRDFTINSMFEDIHGSIHDFYGGQSDIQSKTLRFVGDPAQRIREDYLRALRFFRFWAHLNFNADQAALKAIAAEAKGIQKISQERVTSELWSILAAPYAHDALIAMEQTTVTSYILPEAVTIDERLSGLLKSLIGVQDSIRPWIALPLLLGLLHGKKWVSDDLLSLTRRLRLSEKDGGTLVNIFQGWSVLTNSDMDVEMDMEMEMEMDVAAVLDFAESIETRGEHYTLANFFGPIWRFLAKNQSDRPMTEILERLLSTDQTFQARRKQTLPVNGRDLLALHPKVVGSKIGDAMTTARRAFRNGDWVTRAEGLEFLRNLVF
jgi:tRNA nucleotidyltransferase/poly(A) polymerase